MVKLSIPLRISLLLAFWMMHAGATSQADMAYVKYLSVNRLELEHTQYLTRLRPLLSADSLRILEIKWALQYRNFEIMATVPFEENEYFLRDSNAMILSALWRLEESLELSQSGANYLTTSNFSSCKILGEVWCMGLDPKAFEAHQDWSNHLSESWRMYKNYQRKKYWKAAALSAVIPGLGKWYAHRSRTALINVLGLSAYAWQTWESYQKLGIQHPLTLFNLTVFGVFYTGHIFGSARAVKTRSLELRNKFYKDASLHYRRLYKPLLY